jgi:glutathione S-transferase
LKLYYSPLSPFSRKVRVIAHELGLKLEEVNTSSRGNMEYRRVNPLGKIPALELADGSVLFDSPVICEYLNAKGGGKFFPGDSIWRNNTGRWKALVLQALGDGIMEAALGRVYEDRYRPPELRSADINANNISVVQSSLDALERITFTDPPTIGEITVACALGYVDFRLPEVVWRPTHPKLAAWFEKFSQYPSMQATAPKS